MWNYGLYIFQLRISTKDTASQTQFLSNRAVRTSYISKLRKVFWYFLFVTDKQSSSCISEPLGVLQRSDNPEIIIAVAGITEIESLWIHHTVIIKGSLTIQNQLHNYVCLVILNSFSYIWKYIFAGPWLKFFFAVLS
jgi:hypothetical protein